MRWSTSTHPRLLKSTTLFRKQAFLFHALKLHSDLTLKTTRRHEVCTAEGGQEVIERRLVGQVNHSEAQCYARVLGAEQVVRPCAQVKEMTRCDARRIRVIVLRPVRRNPHAQRAAIRRCTGRNRRCQRGERVAAEEADLRLLVCR